MKRFLKIVRNLLIILLLLIVLAWIALQTSVVQTWVSGLAADYLSEQLGVPVSVGEVNIDFFSDLVAKDVYLADTEGDTLAFMGSLRVKGFDFSGRNECIRLDVVELENPVFHMQKHPGDERWNYSTISDYFNTGTSSSTAENCIQISNIRIRNGRFAMSNQNREFAGGEKIDWSHMDVGGIDLDAHTLSILGDSITLQIDHLDARERSGFDLKELAGKLLLKEGLAILDEAHIQSNQSDLSGRLAFKFQGLEDFDAFEQKVRMNHRFTDSRLEFGDLAYFTSYLKGIQQEIILNGTVRGRVDNLKARDMVIQFGPKSFFRGDCDMIGLPDFDNTFIQLDITSLTTNKKELEAIPVPPFGEGNFLKTPANFADLGQMDFHGNFTGFVYEFAAYGMLETAIGKVISDINMKEVGDTYTYKGQLDTRRFDLAKFYDNPNLGPLSADLKVTGKGLTVDDLDATISGVISAVTFNDYVYTGLNVEGRYGQGFFDGTLEVRDPNLFMDFGGLIDFSSDKPAYEFTANIMNIDLAELGIYEAQEYASLSADLQVKGSGFNTKTLVGDFIFDNITFCSQADECRVERVAINASTVPEGRKFTFASSMVDGTLRGKFDLEKLPLAFEFILADLIPSYPEPQDVREPEEDFDLTVKVHDFTIIQDFFLPAVAVAPETFIHLNVHDERHDFDLKVISDSLGYEGYRTTGTIVDIERLDSTVYLTFLNDRLDVNDDLYFGNFGIDGRTENDTIFTAISWDSEPAGHAGDINGEFTLQGSDIFEFTFEPSSIDLNGERWIINDQAWFAYDKGDYKTRDVEIRKGEEFLRIWGAVSDDPEAQLDLEIAGFDLANLNPFLPEDIQFFGRVTGSSDLRDAYDKQLLNSDLVISGFKLQDYDIGDMCIETFWDSETRQLFLRGEFEKEAFKTLVYNGTYTPSKTENSLDVNVEINRFDLNFVNTFVDEGVSDLNGFASGEVRITGEPGRPKMNGFLDFEDVTVRVDYLNTVYEIEEKASIFEDMFTMDNIRVRDEEGNEGEMVGTIIHDNFSDWSFDIALYLEQPFLLLNTTKEDNDLFYGHVYGAGYANVSGYEDQIYLEGELRNGPNTTLALPLEETGEVAFEDFVTFVDPNAEVVEKALDFSGIQMTFGLDINEDAELELILDEQVGDVMRGRGKGHLDMYITQLETFEMLGRIEVTEGNYLFTLKNLINKEFDIKPGGSIVWYGDPIAGELDLQAIYKVETPLATLLGDENEAYKNRAPVDLLMNLTGKMMTPDIRFDVELPNADQITRSRVSSLLSSEEELNRQAFALLVLKGFVSPHHGGGNAGDAIAVNTLEMLSSQMGLWLSQISEDFDIGINYSPGDEISNEEIAIALSTQLFNEKLRISGNFGVSNGNDANQNPSNLIGDIKIEYSIDEEGRIRLVVYNETNDYAIATTAQSAYTQGVGVIYQEEFDTMDEFYCGFKNLFKREENRVKCKGGIGG